MINYTFKALEGRRGAGNGLYDDCTDEGIECLSRNEYHISLQLVKF